MPIMPVPVPVPIEPVPVPTVPEGPSPPPVVAFLLVVGKERVCEEVREVELEVDVVSAEEEMVSPGQVKRFV